MLDRKVKASGKGGISKFGEILRIAMADKGLNQRQLSFAANISQSYISRIEHGERGLSASIAELLGDHLGGSQAAWLAAFEDASIESTVSAAELAARHLGLTQRIREDLARPYVGTPVRQLREADILRVFGTPTNASSQHLGVYEDCEIEGFNPDHVSMTSYDTRAATFRASTTKGDKGGHVQALKSIVIKKHTYLEVGTLEHIALPSWLEAEIHPASNIALKPLIVSHGPVIDPGWKGYLRVAVFNPSDADVSISLDEPFLTLRFWVAETKDTPSD